MGGSDKRLVQRATRGDRRAFEEIYRRYGPALYRFCLAMTGNRQDAQDALQNTMVKVLRALPGEKRQITLKPWLYRIARNETVEVLRKRNDRDELTLEQTAASTVAETAEVREHLRTLLSDLEQLPHRQRAMLLMRELAGLDFAEIGAAFETSAAVARQTLYEARLSLRQLEEGRERRCADVRKELSDADGRVIRRRKTRAHLRNCPDCRTFYEEIVKRQEGLAAIGVLPLAASAGLLQGLLGGQAGSAGAGGGFGTAGGAAAGQAVATSMIVKSAATVMVGAVAVTVADRGGLVDLPQGGGPEIRNQRAPSARLAPTKPTRSDTGTGDAAGTDISKGPVVSPRVGNGDQSRAQPPAAQPAPLIEQPTAHELEQGKGEPSATSGVDASDNAKSDDSPGSSARSRPEDPPEPATEQTGPPEDLPESSAHGQETAAANKPPQVVSPPGNDPPGNDPGKSSTPDGGPPGKPAAPPGNLSALGGGPPGNPGRP